jgi:hypothetical protein
LNTASRIPPSRLISVCRGHVNDGGFPGSRCLPSCESAPGALAGACRFALPRLAGRRICRASSSLYKTATRPLLDRFRGRERGRTRSHDLCRWMSPRARLWDRSSIPDRGIRGRDDCHPAGSCLLIGAAAGGARGQGSSNRCSTFTAAIARARDFAPTPIAPGTFRRETPSPAGLERRGGRSGAASDERACKARPPTGRWSEGYPRRCPALTGPRCLLSRGRSLTNGRMPVSRS